jgi:peroxiredoxin
MIWLALIIPSLLAVTLAWAFYELLKQYGRKLIMLEQLNARVEALEVERLADREGRQPPSQTRSAQRAGLQIGTLAPPFSLPDAEGDARALSEFAGRRLVLIFFNATCGYCAQMAPRLGDLPEGAPGVVLVSRGDAGLHRRWAEEHHWRCKVLFDQDWNLANAYLVTGTPMGYLIDESGRIASDLAIGADAVMALTAASAVAQSPLRRTGHEGHQSQ